MVLEVNIGDEPDWIRAAREFDIPAHPSMFGWVLDLEANPVRSEEYLAEFGRDASEFFLMSGEASLLSLARELQLELEQEDVIIAPLAERNIDAPDLEASIELLTAEKLAELAGDFEINGIDPDDDVAEAARNHILGKSRLQQLTLNGLFQATVFHAPSGDRQYVFFDESGPLIFFNTALHMPLLASAGSGLDETTVEIIEFGLELVLFALSIVLILAGGNLFKHTFEHGKIGADRVRDFLLKILRNQKMREAFKKIMKLMLGAGALEGIIKGDEAIIRKVLISILELIKAIWKEGALKQLLKILGGEVVGLAAIIGVLWFFGLGEIISALFLVLGLVGIVRDLKKMAAKLKDSKSSRATRPAAPPKKG